MKGDVLGGGMGTSIGGGRLDRGGLTSDLGASVICVLVLAETLVDVDWEDWWRCESRWNGKPWHRGGSWT